MSSFEEWSFSRFLKPARLIRLKPTTLSQCCFLQFFVVLDGAATLGIVGSKFTAVHAPRITVRGYLFVALLGGREESASHHLHPADLTNMCFFGVLAGFRLERLPLEKHPFLVPGDVGICDRLFCGLCLRCASAYSESSICTLFLRLFSLRIHLLWALYESTA